MKRQWIEIRGSWEEIQKLMTPDLIINGEAYFFKRCPVKIDAEWTSAHPPYSSRIENH